MKNILDYRSRPIPDLTDACSRRKVSRQYPLVFSHERSFDPCVRIEEYDIAGCSYYHQEQGNPPYNHRAPGSLPVVLMRKTVAEMLASVNERLRSVGIEIYVFDAYRPVQVQDYFFLEWMPAELRKRHPEWDEELIELEKRNYWGRGSDENGKVDPLSPPFHSTGGAVDLLLRDTRTKELIHTGSFFDDFSSASSTDFYERLLLTKNLNEWESEALLNRRLLYWALVEGGLVNNPKELWHFSYGDQLWAAIRGEDEAFYSFMLIDPDSFMG